MVEVGEVLDSGMSLGATTSRASARSASVWGTGELEAAGGGVVGGGSEAGVDSEAGFSCARTAGAFAAPATGASMVGDCVRGAAGTPSVVGVSDMWTWRIGASK
jgi:hypothetical protein